MDDEEKVLAGRPDANFPALLTKDVQGGDARSLLTERVRLIRTPGCALGSANGSRELVCAVANAVPMRAAEVTPG